jgi:hypothetical protein
MNSKNGILDPSQICKFKTGCGELFRQDTINGRSVFIRFVCMDMTTNSPQCVAEHFPEVCPNGTVLVGRRWKNLGSQLDLRTLAVAKAKAKLRELLTRTF